MEIRVKQAEGQERPPEGMRHEKNTAPDTGNDDRDRVAVEGRTWLGMLRGCMWFHF